MVIMVGKGAAAAAAVGGVVQEARVPGGRMGRTLRRCNVGGTVYRVSVSPSLSLARSLAISLARELSL